MSYFPFAFEGPVEQIDYGRFAYSVLYLPPDLAAELPFDKHPRLRVSAEVADVPVRGAWQPAGDGRFYLLLSRRLLTAAGARPGGRVEIRFRIDDQDAVEVPEELADALASDPAIDSAWQALTAGARRAFAHRVASAKGAATRARRVAEVVGMVARGEKPGAPSRARRQGRRGAVSDEERS